MKTLTSRLFVVGIAALLPSVASAHTGHENDGILMQIFHHDHLLMYVAPVVVIAGAIYAAHKKNNALAEERKNTER